MIIEIIAEKITNAQTPTAVPSTGQRHAGAGPLLPMPGSPSTHTNRVPGVKASVPNLAVPLPIPPGWFDSDWNLSPSSCRPPGHTEVAARVPIQYNGFHKARLEGR